MRGDPKECREHAKRCLKIAQEATNPALRASLEDIAQQWLRLAADLEATKPVLEHGAILPFSQASIRCRKFCELSTAFRESSSRHKVDCERWNGSVAIFTLWWANSLKSTRRKRQARNRRLRAALGS